VVVATCLLVLSPRPALAHGGLYAGADNVATVLVAADLAVIAWFRHLGRRAKAAAGPAGPARTRWVLLPLAVGLPIAAVTTTSWVPKNLPSKTRPVATARLEIVAPRANEVVGPSFTVELRLLGGRIVPLTTLRNRPNQGHIHVAVDGRLMAMTAGLNYRVDPPLPPGLHTIEADFVAADHGPFRTPVVAAVQVEVRK
jgi:hypothetical protein